MIVRLAWLLGLAACAGTPTERPLAVSQLPICSAGGDLARLDGQRVTVVGIYRKRLVGKKGRPATEFHGQAQVELTGKATDYDPAAWDGALAIVSLGLEPRPADEVARFVDRPVAVAGRLVVHPPPEDPQAASAQRPPTLFELGEIVAK